MSSYSWNYVWSGCCHSKGFGVDAATPLDITPYCGGEGCTDSKTISLPRLPSADTSKASPCQSFSSSCYQPGHGLLGRNKCCIHPQGLPCTFNWCHNAFWGKCKKSKNLLALSSAGKTKASFSLRCTGKNENLVEYLKHHPLKAFKMFLC